MDKQKKNAETPKKVKKPKTKKVRDEEENDDDKRGLPDVDLRRMLGCGG